MKFKLTESVLTTRGRILTNIPKTSDVQQNQTFNTASVNLIIPRQGIQMQIFFLNGLWGISTRATVKTKQTSFTTSTTLAECLLNFCFFPKALSSSVESTAF